MCGVASREEPTGPPFVGRCDDDQVASDAALTARRLGGGLSEIALMSGKVCLHFGWGLLLHHPMEKYVSKKMKNLPLFYFAAPGPSIAPHSDYPASLANTWPGHTRSRPCS